MSKTNPRARTRSIAVVAAIAIALTAAGCSALTPGGASNSDASQPAGKKLTGAEVAKAGKITLHMSDYETTGDTGLSGAINQDIASFEAKYPNIKIVRSSKAPGDYHKTTKLALSSDDAPDIAEANAVDARTLVPGKLVRPLDAYYDAYGWKDRYPASILGVLRAAPTGKSFGTGNYWGTSLGGNIVGLYYNADKLKSLALTPPKTFAELEDDLAVAKSKGEIPMQLGNLEQAAGNHVLSTLMNDFEDPAKVNDWINGKPGSSFETPGIKEALNTLHDWAVKGYLPAQANGTREDDAAAAFVDGKGVFQITGSWREDQYDTGLGEAGGFMLLPPKTAGGTSYATGSIAEAFTISSKSKHPDIAAFFLDYLTGAESTDNNVAGGYLPFSGTATRADGGPIAKDVLAAWNTAVQNNGLTGYLDSATPSMNDTLFPALQSLIGSQQSADQVAATSQANWDDYHTGS